MIGQAGIVGPNLLLDSAFDCCAYAVADSVTVFSENVASADAWATAICNELRQDDQTVLSRLAGTDVTAVVAIMGEEIISWGDPPPHVRAKVNPDIITRGKDTAR